MEARRETMKKSTDVQIIDWAYSSSQVLSFWGKPKRRSWDNSGTKQLALACYNAGETRTEIVNNLPFLVWVDEWMETFVRYQKTVRKKKNSQSKAFFKMLNSIDSTLFESRPHSSLGVLCKLIVWKEKREQENLFPPSSFNPDEIICTIMRDLESFQCLIPSRSPLHSKRAHDDTIGFLKQFDLEDVLQVTKAEEVHPFLFSQNFFTERAKST